MNDQSSSASQKSAVIILTTPRLILRTTTEDDIAILQNLIFGDSDVMRYAFAGVPMSKDRAEAFMRRFFTFGDSLTGMSTLTMKSTGEVIGFAGLVSCDALGADDFEIGFLLGRSFWGRGIATEIGEAQLAFGFDQIGCHRLLGLVDPRNVPSTWALKKLGMRYVKDVADPMRATRSVYVLEAEKWRKRSE